MKMGLPHAFQLGLGSQHWQRENPPFLLKKEGFVLELFFFSYKELSVRAREGLSKSRVIAGPRTLPFHSSKDLPHHIFIWSKDQAHQPLLLA